MAHKKAGMKAPRKKQAATQPEKRVYFKHADFPFLIGFEIRACALGAFAHSQGDDNIVGLRIPSVLPPVLPVRSNVGHSSRTEFHGFVCDRHFHQTLANRDDLFVNVMVRRVRRRVRSELRVVNLDGHAFPILAAENSSRPAGTGPANRK